MAQLYEYTIDYGYGVAEMVTTVPENKATECFYKLANQCFGIRKSITKDPEVRATRNVGRPGWWPADVVESLSHNGDLILWNAEGEKVKDEWD